MNTTHYVTYFQPKDKATDKFPKGWYAFQATLDTLGAIVIHRNAYNFSKTSRGEAVEKLFRQRVGLTRNGEFTHTGILSLDHLYNDRPI